MKVKSESEVTQSCLTLSDRMDCSLPDFFHGILQARILECVAISFSRESSRPRDRTQVSHIAGRCFNLCATREALKYKNTNIKDFKGRKGSQVERRGRRRERGVKGVALQTSPATYRYPGIMGLFPGPPEKGGLELGPTRNQNQNSSSLPRGGDQSPILSSG